MFLQGHIVEFLDSDQVRLGYVRKQERDRLRIVDPKGRNLTISEEHVFVTHRQIPESDFPSAALQIGELVSQRRGELDVELLWQSLGGASREFDVKELAEIFFSHSTPDAMSAIFHALHEDTLYFKRRGARFVSKTPDQVSVERLSRERQREREESRDRLGGIIERLLKRPSDPITPDAALVIDRIHEWTRRHGDAEVGGIIERLVGPQRAREAAYEILVRAGRISAEADRFLAIAGIEGTFSPGLVEAAARISPLSAFDDRTDYRMLPAITIDDDDTAEIDDALTVQEVNGELIVGIHIANTSAFVEKDDALDLEAARRLSTIYLPASTVLMIPERVSKDLASLIAGEERPAFTVEARFDAQLNRLGYRVTLSALRVGERLSYEEADRRLEANDPGLTALKRVAAHLRESRAAQGAVTMRRPELKIRVYDDDIQVKRIDPNSPSRLLVSEMMILANALVADLAIIRGAPVIFRTQERRELPAGDTPENEALAFERLRRTFKRSRLSLTPGPHAGLGLTAYTQASSPIRRFADLVTQRQLSALIQGRPLVYGRDDLLRVLGAAEAAESEIRSLEERATHYWILEHLARRRMHDALPATVLDAGGAIELQDYYLRGKLSGGPFRPGETIEVAIESIDPAGLDVRFKVH
jgi:exoribonuclease-2